MTLVVSLIVPDGVVLAADSLQTTTAKLRFPGQVMAKDAKGNDITVGQIQLPPISIPTSTSSYAQKLFPFNKKFGVATFGSGIINNRTIYNHIKTLDKEPHECKSVTQAAKTIEDYFTNQVQKQLAETAKKIDIKATQFVVGFQIVGYESSDDNYGKVIEVAIGKETKSRVHDQIGCSVSGDTIVVQKLSEISQKTNFRGFSLQDAIDYCNFLIETTSRFQRFTNSIPTVGGEVDIALITNYGDFTWIRYKELTRILEKMK